MVDKKNQGNNTSVLSVVEVICGCKWSLRILNLINQDINRPGQLTQQLEGLSTKVLNQCLRKHLEFGILTKVVYPVSPPKVEYQLTKFGKKLIYIIEQINQLEYER